MRTPGSPAEPATRRISIALLLGLILATGLILAALRSASNDAFKLIYGLTFLLLVYAAIAARYRGAFWHGFAIAGVAYFLVGFGPWINSLSSTVPQHAVNRNLGTSVVLEIVNAWIARTEPRPPYGDRARIIRYLNNNDLRYANRNGITHCALTLLFALGGGQVSRTLARRSRM